MKEVIAEDLVIVSMDEITPEKAEWLVPGYIPRGTISLLAGDGGTGKSSIWCSLAAAISSGERVFFDAAPEEEGSREPEIVLAFSAEDSTKRISLEKMKNAGANLKNIISVNDGFSPKIRFNSQELEYIISKHKPGLVIFDPIQSFLPGNGDIYKRNFMRENLNSLIQLSEKYGTTFLIVVHTNKKQGIGGRKRISDSSDLWDASRSVIMCGNTLDGYRYLAHEKCNYGHTMKSVIFSIDDGVPKFIEFSDKQDIDFSLELNRATGKSCEKEKAKRFICDFLKDGMKPTAELDKAAKNANITQNSLKKAKAELASAGILGRMSPGYGKNKKHISLLLDKDASTDGGE